MGFFKYSRLVKMSWDSDSRSARTDAINALCSLARELVQVQIFDKNPDEEFKWNGEWVIPAECIDEDAWLDWAIEYIEKLGHYIDWIEYGGMDGRDGKCTVKLIGRDYPHLLGKSGF